MDYKKLWEALDKVYGHRKLKSFTICNEPNKEYPSTTYDLTIKGCMDYIEGAAKNNRLQDIIK